MGDENDGGFFVAGKLGKKLNDEGTGRGVEIACGFIGQKNGGTMDESTGNGGALKLAARELVGAMVGAVGELDGFKKIAGTIAGSGGDATCEEQGKKDIFLHRQSGEEMKKLENKSDFESPNRG